MPMKWQNVIKQINFKLEKNWMVSRSGNASPARPYARTHKQTDRLKTKCDRAHPTGRRRHADVFKWLIKTQIIIVSLWEKKLHTTHTHTFNGPFSGLPRWAGTRKVKPIWIILKQVTASGSGISWAICKSAPCSRQITTPAPPPLSFLQAGCPSCRPTNSVNALWEKKLIHRKRRKENGV